MTNYIMLLSGLLLLFIGGEILIRGSVQISKRLGISAILIGVVVVGFGTSTPELLVSMKASLAGQSDIALGNAVGSNIANTLLILGIASVITPIICKDKAIHRDSFSVVIASTVLMGLSYFQIISQFAGLLMFVSLIAYLIYSYKAEKKDKVTTIFSRFTKTAHEHEAKEFDKKGRKLSIAILMSTCGIAMLVFGADFLVKGASNLARQFGISEAIIGLSLVAIGTSLPELVTAISASIKKNSDVVIGNVLGSSLFNILGILGITSAIKPITINKHIANFDIPLNLAIAVILLLITLILKRFERWIGIIFLVIYVIYVAILYLS